MPRTIDFPYPRTGGPVNPFDEFASATIAAGANADVLAFRVDTQSRIGYLTRLGHGIDVAAWATTVWSIRVNGVPVRFYGNVQDQIGTFDDPAEIGPVVVRAGDLVSVNVANNDIGAHLFAVRLRGFTEG